jgi:hypothetical protein
LFTEKDTVIKAGTRIDINESEAFPEYEFLEGNLENTDIREKACTDEEISQIKKTVKRTMRNPRK